MTDSLSLKEAVERIRPADQEAMGYAARRQRTLTKPEESLGVLEEISIKLAGIFADHLAVIGDKAVVVAGASA